MQAVEIGAAHLAMDRYDPIRYLEMLGIESKDFLLICRNTTRLISRLVDAFEGINRRLQKAKIHIREVGKTKEYILRTLHAEAKMSAKLYKKVSRNSSKIKRMRPIMVINRLGSGKR